MNGFNFGAQSWSCKDFYIIGFLIHLPLEGVLCEEQFLEEINVLFPI